MLNRTLAPQFKDPVEFVLQKPVRISSTGQTPIYTLYNGNLPTLRIEFVCRAGKWFEPSASYAVILSKMLLEGTPKYTSEQISAFLDQYGVFTECQPGSDYLVFSLYLLDKHAKNVLPFIAEILETASYPNDELENIKNIQKQNLLVNLNKNSFLAYNNFKTQLFGSSHPYGKNDTPTSIEAISSEGLRLFHEKSIKNNFEIIASGAVDKNIENLLLANFTKYTSNAFSTIDKPFVADNRGLHKTPKENSIQSSFRIGSFTINDKHPDYFSLEIFNTIFGGYFGSRLMQNIREDKGYTYGIHSSLMRLHHASFLMISTDAKKEFEGKILEEVLREIEILQTQQVPDDEYYRVINYIKGTFLSGIDNVFSQADKFKNLHFYGLPDDYYDNYFQKIDAVKPSDVLEIANKHINPAHFTTVIVG